MSHEFHCQQIVKAFKVPYLYILLSFCMHPTACHVYLHHYVIIAVLGIDASGFTM